MPTFIGHAVAAMPVNVTIMRGKNTGKIFWLSLLCAVIPDLDGIGYAVGIRYDSLFGHRGFSHSILFAFLLAALMTVIFFPEITRWSKSFNLLVLNFFLIGIIHIMLDAMTNGGLGVALFSPLSNYRFFMPWRPIPVSAILPRYFFALDGWQVIRGEALYIILPSLVYSGLFFLINRRRLRPA